MAESSAVEWSHAFEVDREHYVRSWGANRDLLRWCSESTSIALKPKYRNKHALLEGSVTIGRPFWNDAMMESFFYWLKRS
ncbi:hypothetical protein EG328_009786 [Venturia inaequalis]|uniref:Uncharacterized protein n=1 Tax=Venturia inaequalis TaxID=5025 RepID=A0A8H3YMQ4_VENIN|nr:hypothetical protein EG328_009786 [Venturia inaequalis]